MGKLHELLAVESDLENNTKKIMKETQKIFKEKGAFFIKQEKETKLFDENAKNPPIEKNEMTTTVNEKLNYTTKSIISYFDAIAQKEKTNQEAMANVEIDGTIIIKNMPATLLLGLESRLKQIRELYNDIPTLPPGGKWVKDTTLGNDVYRNENEEVRFKTAKTFQHKVLYEATKEHPAQIEKWEEVQNTGEIIIKIWSSMLSSKEKSDLLSRLDVLIYEIKKARQRANCTKINKMKIGKTIFDYIHNN